MRRAILVVVEQSGKCGGVKGVKSGGWRVRGARYGKRD